MAAPGQKEENSALARELGKRGVDQLEAGLARIMAESGANSRAVLAALVLLNGGGIAVVAAQNAVLGAEAIAQAISFFVVGAALAVLAALVTSLAGLILPRQIAEASALWAQVANSGELSEDALKAAGKVRRNGLVSTLAALGVSLLSLILFVAGAMTLGSGLAPSEAVVPEAQSNAVEPANVEVPAPVPAPVVTPTPTPITTPSPAPTPEPKAAPPPKAKPEPRRRSRPSATETPAPSAAPAATPPPAAPAQTPAAAPATN